MDLPIGASAEAYRTLVAKLKTDPEAAGSVVTTHKVALFESSADLFDSLDRSVTLFEEIACVTSSGRGLSANTIDPMTAARALSEMVPGPVEAANAIVLGAGGAGMAVAAALLADGRSKWTVTVTDIVETRLARAERILSRLSVRDRARLLGASGSDGNDRVVEDAPPGSLIINATGMGKDAPGSPVSARISFPEGGLVWDLNYRGELLFLDQARAQARDLGLRVEDGRRLFLHGWAEGLSQILERKVSVETLEWASEWSQTALG